MTISARDHDDAEHADNEEGDAEHDAGGAEAIARSGDGLVEVAMVHDAATFSTLTAFLPLPLSLSTRSKVTLSFFASSCSGPLRLVRCTKTSSLESSGRMKPKPFSSRKNLTVPVERGIALDAYRMCVRGPALA